MIEIEKNIPIPSKRTNKFPFEKMKVGDSFFVAAEGEEARRAQQSLSAYAYRHKNNGKKFTTRAVNGGVRVWRTA